MMRSKHLAVTLLGAALLAPGGGPARGQSGGEQLYFVGMTAPLGSLSNPGSTTTGVYLRWDITEGELPSDLAQFVLELDGNPIATLPASTTMSAVDIAGLYAGVENERRKLEIIRWLDSEDDATTVDESNYASVIAGRIDPASPDFDNFWATLASRADFNVARARHLAYLDDRVLPGVHTYELLGESTGGDQVRIGEVTLDTSVVTTLKSGTSFEQVSLTRCDLPGRFQDHGTIALTWDHPGKNRTEVYLNRLLVTGYDLWRTTANVGTADPALSLRSLAQLVVHAPDGTLALEGLEKVNDAPITIAAQPETETARSGWNPPFAQILETLEELEAREVFAGDTRAYYLVGRDYTGNYTDTAELLVVVPDLLAPPAPWGVRGVPDPTTDGFALEWEAVDLLNYHGEFEYRRTFCNYDEARVDRELRFVTGDDTCETGTQVRVDVDAEDYLVYRFERSDLAGSFKDSDGDGYADVDERPNLDEVGTACDDSQVPGTATNYLAGVVSGSSAVTLPDGRKIIRFDDPTPATIKGDVFWYRIASRDPDGNVGELSEPVRGFFPDRTRPLRDELTAGGFVFGIPGCAYKTSLFRTPDPDLPFGIDSTPEGLASNLNLICESNPGIIRYEQDFPVQDLFGVRGAEMNADQCNLILELCNSFTITVQFEGATGDPLGGPVVFSPPHSCPFENVELTEDCNGQTIRPIDPGVVLDEPVTLDFPGAVDCTNIYRDIGGTDYKVATVCPGEWPFVYDAPNLGGESVCLSVALSNDNAVVSSKERLPCYRSTTLAPEPPTPLAIQFTAGSDQAQLAWLPPEQPNAGTIVQWFQKGGGAAGSGNEFFPHPGQTTQDGPVAGDATITVEPAGTDWQEEWCFRGRTVGFAAPGGEEFALSDWSAELCGIRLPAGDTPPVYLPWPKVPLPEETGAMEGRYLAPLDNRFLFRMSDVELDFGPECFLQIAQCDQNDSTAPPCIDTSPDRRRVVPSGNCTSFCSDLRAAAAPHLGFVAYRQSRADAADTPSEYHQVSPLIDTLFCDQDFKRQPPDPPVLDDPYVYLLSFPTGDLWEGLQLVFADPFPHIGSREYRYQFVYFGTDGEILDYRTTEWILAD